MGRKKGLIRRTFEEIRIIVISVFLTLILVPTFILFNLPIYLFRFLLAKSAPWVRPDLGKILSTRSAIVAVDDLYKAPRCTLLVATTVEGKIDIDFIREEMLTKVILARSQDKDKVLNKNRRNNDCVSVESSEYSDDAPTATNSSNNSSNSNSHDDISGAKCALKSNPSVRDRVGLNYPEFQQYWVKWADFTFWKWDENFEIGNHVKLWEESESREVNEIDVAKLRLELVKKPYERNQSPWEMIIVRNFVPTSEADLKPEERTKKSVIIFRVHHGVADGYSLLQCFMTQMIGEIMTQNKLSVPKPTIVQRHWASSFLLHVATCLMIPYNVVRNQFECRDRNPFHLPEEKLTRKILPATDRIPMDVIQTARKVNGDVTFSAVILAMLAGGIRKFMIDNQMEIPESMHVITPLPMPNHPSKLRNYWTYCIVKLPMSISDAKERLRFCHKHWAGLKKSAKPAVNFGVVPLVGGLPDTLMRLFVRNTLGTIMYSNFPGPPANSQMFGHPVVDISFGGGLGRGNLGFGMAMLSHKGSLRVNIGVDQGILQTLPKVQELMSALTREVHVLAAEDPTQTV